MKEPVDESTINPLCRKCLRQCKQPVSCLLVECPRFFSLPFKVEKHKFDQMGLFDEDEQGGQQITALLPVSVGGQQIIRWQITC
jgi:hypothetical protein